MSEIKNNKISVGIINLEFHNLFSIFHAIKSLGYKVKVYSLEHVNYNSDILILPGVGSFNLLPAYMWYLHFIFWKVFNFSSY